MTESRTAMQFRAHIMQAIARHICFISEYNTFRSQFWRTYHCRSSVLERRMHQPSYLSQSSATISSKPGLLDMSVKAGDVLRTSYCTETSGTSVMTTGHKNVCSPRGVLAIFKIEGHEKRLCWPTSWGKSDRASTPFHQYCPIRSKQSQIALFQVKLLLQAFSAGFLAIIGPYLQPRRLELLRRSA